VVENVSDQHFIQPVADKVWAAVITYVCTCEGWLYLAVELDLFSTWWLVGPKTEVKSPNLKLEIWRPLIYAQKRRRIWQ
jgi:putative transposase